LLSPETLKKEKQKDENLFQFVPRWLYERIAEADPRSLKAVVIRLEKDMAKIRSEATRRESGLAEEVVGKMRDLRESSVGSHGSQVVKDITKRCADHETVAKAMEAMIPEMRSAMVTLTPSPSVDGNSQVLESLNKMRAEHENMTRAMAMDEMRNAKAYVSQRNSMSNEHDLRVLDDINKIRADHETVTKALEEMRSAITKLSQRVGTADQDKAAGLLSEMNRIRREHEGVNKTLEEMRVTMTKISQSQSVCVGQGYTLPHEVEEKLTLALAYIEKKARKRRLLSR